MATIDAVVIYENQIRAYAHTTLIRDALLRACDEVVHKARSAAPKRTGTGAASIKAVAFEVPEGWEVDISWDTAHHYMIFQELGTRKMRPHSFLRPALAR